MPQKLITYQIVNKSGLTILPRHIEVLKKCNVKILNETVGGDAPKDLIRVYEYGKARKSNHTKWTKYIAKIGHKWYPNESITEHLLTRVGNCFGLIIANSKVVYAENCIRFLSEHFHSKYQILDHGANILSSYMNEDTTQWIDELEKQKSLRQDINVESVFTAIKNVFPNEAEKIINALIHMLLFDCLTGNNDRHYYNWGVISHIKGQHKPYFSPVYDSARGLLWNKSDEKVISLHKELNNLNNKQLEKYVFNSVPKISIPNNSSCNHFELIEYLKSENYLKDEHYKIWTNQKSIQKAIDLLEGEFKNLFIKERKGLIKIILNKRFNKIVEILK
ncbi:MAG: HipA domain-containing protein [Flavobacterium sp.]